ncbi:head-tail adaptor protein [Streptomyces sp. CA-250714]|uniref:head-tail adaptor protein n=1 Tax=Streptomyces sp. CA-250714 TaxID=3240060 RepID=UPI003D8E364B
MSRVSRLLNTAREVWRPTRAPDGGGGWETTMVQVGTVRTRLSQPSARERVVADQSQSRLTHVAYLEPGADVQREDELRGGPQPLRVLALFEPSEPGTYLRADCEAMQP